MIMPAEDSSPNDADRLAADWLDDESADMDAEAQLQHLDEADCRRIADQQLLHALLFSLHGRQQPDRRALAARVMQAIGTAEVGAGVPADAEHELASRSETALASPQVHRPPSRRRWIIQAASWATAAAVLLAAFLISNTRFKNPLNATVTRAIDAAEQPVDRTYRLMLSRISPLGLKIDSEATLYVRGGEKFVVRHPAPLLGDFFLGSNGRQSWFVPVFGPVIVDEQSELINAWLNKHGLATPFMELGSMMRTLESRFELEFSESHDELKASEEKLDYIVGRRRPGIETEADRVELRIHPGTGVIHKLVLQHDDPRTGRGVHRVSIELSSEEPLPENWYEHDSHHRAGRLVSPLPAIADDLF